MTKRKRPPTARELDRKRQIDQGRWMGRGSVHKSRKTYSRRAMKEALRRDQDS